MLTIDIRLLGYRFHLSLAESKPAAPAKPEESPPTQLSTPMVVHAGRVGFYQERGNEMPVGSSDG